MRKAWCASAFAASLVLAACGREGEEVDARGEAAPGVERDAAAGAGEASADGASRGAPEQATRRAARGKRAARAIGVRRVDGTIERATSERVVIRPPGQEPLTLRIGPATTVRLDGRAAPPESLAQGSEVRAAYQREEGRARALSIDARTPGAAAAGPHEARRPPGELPSTNERGGPGGR